MKIEILEKKQEYYRICVCIDEFDPDDRSTKKGFSKGSLYKILPQEFGLTDIDIITAEPGVFIHNTLGSTTGTFLAFRKSLDKKKTVTTVTKRAPKKTKAAKKTTAKEE